MVQSNDVPSFIYLENSHVSVIGFRVESEQVEIPDTLFFTFSLSGLTRKIIKNTSIQYQLQVCSDFHFDARLRFL